MPVITIPERRSGCCRPCRPPPHWTEHVVAEAVAEEAAEQALAAQAVDAPPLTKLSRLRKQTLNPSPKWQLSNPRWSNLSSTPPLMTKPVAVIDAVEQTQQVEAIPEEVAPAAEAAPVVIAEETATAEAEVVEMPAAVQTEPATSPEVKVSKGAGVLACARKAYAPMATPAAAPAPTPVNPWSTLLVRSEVVTSGRHGGSTAASNVATSPAGRPEQTVSCQTEEPHIVWLFYLFLGP